MTNPYQDLEDYRFWRRAVSRVERHALDPVVSPRFSLTADDRVATAGSCFAQHISRKLEAAGFNYFVVETAEDPAAARERNFGVFSARYGNIYTTGQLLQLFLRAHGRFAPMEDAWKRPDGRFVDPFRPAIEPDGFASVEALHEDRARHLASVRRLFAESDVLVFTLGLTEGWRSKADGAVFPIAPGVVAGEYDASAHGFFNLGVEEVVADMEEFLRLLREINPGVRVLLTVSPVPLMATFENRHVLSATTYSKSVLRVAAEYLLRRDPLVDYFPSYEIITGSFAAGMYYREDAREVNEQGVAHAMRCFMRNYLEGGEASPVASAPADGDVLCDEEALGQIRA